MAQNRELEPEHLSSSDEEEEEQGSSEEHQGSESDPEEDDDNTSPPEIKKPSASKKPDANPTSSDATGSESDSDADSDLPPAKVNPNIKPIATKPMEKKPRSKPMSPPPSAGVKRPAVESEVSDLKRMKKKITDEDTAGSKKSIVDDSKKQFFQRLWSEDDEIVVLKGLMDYRAKKGTDPMADMNAFHDFIKKSLHIDVSKTQLSDKVRRLKKKFENNVGKEKKGKELTLPKPHEQKAYELSKKIWGKDGNSSVFNNGIEKKNQTLKASNAPKPETFSAPKNEVSNVSKMEIETNVDLSRSILLNRGSVEAPLGVERIIMNELELIEGPKKSELDEKWKKLQHEEIELYLKRVELIREQTKLVLESLKSGRN